MSALREAVVKQSPSEELFVEIFHSSPVATHWCGKDKLTEMAEMVETSGNSRNGRCDMGQLSVVIIALQRRSKETAWLQHLT